MTHATKKLKNSELELTITLDQKDLEFYVKKATDELNDTVTIKGYRKGKAPEDLVKKSVGEDQVKENALNIAVQESLRKTLNQQEGWDVLNYSDLKIKENTPEKLVYTVLLTLSPEIKLGKYEGLKIVSKPISITEDEINKTLKEIQDSRTEFKDSDDTAKMGDRVEVDFEVSDQGKIIEGGKSDNHPLIIGKQTFVPGFEEQLVGMKAGEEKQFSLKMPEDYHDPVKSLDDHRARNSIAGKELDFKVVMKKVSSPVTVELTDAFVQTLGNFVTVAQLKDSIQAGLLEEKKSKEAERIKLAILDEILKTTQVEIPPKLLDEQLDIMVGNFDQELHQRGLELGLYLAHLKKTQEEFRKSFIPQAEKQSKISLIIKAVGKKEAIIVTDQEVDTRLQEINAAINLQDELVQRGLDIETLRNRIRQSLFTEKIFDFLLKKSNVTLT